MKELCRHDFSYGDKSSPFASLRNHFSGAGCTHRKRSAAASETRGAGINEVSSQVVTRKAVAGWRPGEGAAEEMNMINSGKAKLEEYNQEHRGLSDLYRGDPGNQQPRFSPTDRLKNQTNADYLSLFLLPFSVFLKPRPRQLTGWKQH